jgi:hypothetical protein
MRALIALLLTCQLVIGCEADGLIWMPPTDKADPLFRFIRDGRAGFIDAQGKIVIQPALRVRGNWDQYFTDGMLSLGASDGPFIDTTGREVIDGKLDRVWDFSEGLAPAVEKFPTAPWGYIDRKGAWVITPRFPAYPQGLVSNFSDGLAAIETNGKLGYIDHTGQFVIPQRYVAGTDFEDGIARVAVSGPCSYRQDGSIDPCSQIQPHRAPSTGPDQSMRVDLPRCRWGFIDKTGKWLFNAEFERTLGFHEGLAAVAVNNKWGFINKRGSFVIPPRFTQVHSFSDGLALVDDGVVSGYIDPTGRARIPATFHKAEPFPEGLAVIGHPDDGYIFVNKMGKQAIPERYLLASRFFHGVAHVKLKGGKYGGGEFAYIDRTGKRVFTYTR